MSYFRKAADYYATAIQRSGHENIAALIVKCRAKTPRGINLVDISPKQLGFTFTPSFFFDPGHICLSYERLVEHVKGFDEKCLAVIKTQMDAYNPEKELLFMVVQVGTEKPEMYIYKIVLPEDEQDKAKKA